MDNLPCLRKIYRLNNFVSNRISTDRKVSKTGNWANPLRALLNFLRNSVSLSLGFSKIPDCRNHLREAAGDTGQIS